MHAHTPQVLTCEDVIGWRDRTATGMDRGLTRVVLFMTDDAFHYSGEGQVCLCVCVSVCSRTCVCAPIMIILKPPPPLPLS